MNNSEKQMKTFMKRNFDGEKLNFRWKWEQFGGIKKNSVDKRKFNVTYPRFGPFGARIGNAIPTKPQKAVIKITGMAPMFIESVDRKWNGKTIEKKWENRSAITLESCYSHSLYRLITRAELMIRIEMKKKHSVNHMIWQ